MSWIQQIFNDTTYPRINRYVSTLFITYFFCIHLKSLQYPHGYQLYQDTVFQYSEQYQLLCSICIVTLGYILSDYSMILSVFYVFNITPNARLHKANVKSKQSRSKQSPNIKHKLSLYVTVYYQITMADHVNFWKTYW